jgi:dihydroxyacetone kinase-like predicted kinase
MIKIFILTFFAIFLDANNLKEQTFIIEKVRDDQATINIGQLQIGQSGVVIHKFKNNKSIILTNASVVSSNNNQSVIRFLSNKILEQNSISNTNIVATNGDEFILNHMYSVSLLIVPNYESYTSVMKKYKNNFIDSELFASFLKINNNPTPSKDDIMKFTLQNNIATIYFVIQNKLYIIDALTFKIIQTKKLDIKNTKTQVPFYTKIDKFEKSFFDFIGNSEIENYNNYYKILIGVKQ